MRIDRIQNTNIHSHQNSSSSQSRITFTKNKTTESIAPKELLERYKKGEYPKVQNLKDKIIQELETLAQQYKQSMTVENKKKLLNKEREILFNELEHPELALARKYEEIVFAMLVNKDVRKEETEDLLRLMSVTGLHREITLEGKLKNETIKEEQIDILKEAFLKSNESNIGLETKESIIEILSYYNDKNPKLSDKISNTLDYLYKHTQNQDLKDNIISVNSKNTLENYFKEFNKINSNHCHFLNILINEAHRKNKKVHKLISDVLISNNTPINLKKRAILGAGKFRNDRNFEIIKKIALDINEKDIRKREFALQSIAMYLREKPEDVKEIMKTVSEEDSVFAPLGRILNDKVNGNYHSQKNRELNYANIKGEKAKDFRYRLKKFFINNKKLSTKKINSLERNTIPFINRLKKIYKINKFLIINKDESITSHLTELIGERYISPWAILNSGAFMDAYDGLNTKEYNLMNIRRVDNHFHENPIAHELGHTIQKMFKEEDSKTIEKLYKKAIEEGRIMDSYAQKNVFEYFAQGCDAYASYYKPHKLLLLNHPAGHTIYELMDTDPELFKFIKKILKHH